MRLSGRVARLERDRPPNVCSCRGPVVLRPGDASYDTVPAALPPVRAAAAGGPHRAGGKAHRGAAVRLAARVARLERGGTGAPCPVCGYHPDEPPRGLRVEIPEAVDNIRDAPAREIDRSADFCAGCGRQLTFRIIFE